MTTQLLFGEIFTILQISENKKWLEIEIFHDNYVGWIDVLQCTSVSKKYFKDYTENISKHKVLSSNYSIFSPIDKKSNGEKLYDSSIWGIQGSILPFFVEKSATEKFKIAKKIYTGCFLLVYKNSKKISKEKIRKQIAENALDYLNTPYLWGGRSIFGIDCSGLIQQIFRSVGYYLPRDAYQQAEKGKLVDFDAKKQGDLAFFMRENKVIHVGIVLKNDKIIHARGQVRIDKLTNIGILDDTNEYSHQLAFIKRIL